MNNEIASTLLDISIELATVGGKRALAGRRDNHMLRLNQVSTKSTSTDMVTEFDRATEEFVISEIRTRRPNDSIIGEEGGSHTGTSSYNWCIDPIDGTTNFLYGLPGWSVSIGVSDGVGPLVGVVYIPALDELFTATRGGGAFLNNKSINCNEISDVSKALVCTGFSYRPETRTIQSQRVSRFIHKIRDIRRLGAASIDICFVACGRLDAYFEENLYPWDLAAGELIAIEAGARSGDFRGGKSRPEEVMIASPGIFDALGSLITQAELAG